MTPLFLDLKSVKKLHRFEMGHPFRSAITCGFHNRIIRARVGNLMKTLQVTHVNIDVLLLILRKQRHGLLIQVNPLLLILVGKQLVTPILKVLIGLIKCSDHQFQLLVLLRLQLNNNIGQLFVFRLKFGHFLQL